MDVREDSEFKYKKGRLRSKEDQLAILGSNHNQRSHF